VKAVEATRPFGGLHGLINIEGIYKNPEVVLDIQPGLEGALALRE
jgi:hypothetical protein